MAKLTVFLVLLFCIAILGFNPALVSATGSCLSLCPGSRQVVATCSVNDSTNTSTTFWDGISIADCPGPFLRLSHAVASAGFAESDSCVGTTFVASIVSVEGSVFTSELSLIPTSSNDGEQIHCAVTTVDNVIQECTLDVLSVNTSGVIEQRGLSEVFVNVTLVDESGSVCVNEYFTIFNGSRVNSSDSTFGPFPVNLCTMPEISDLIVGTSRNGVDGPTTTVDVFTADTTNLYSNLAVSHLYDVSGVTLDLSWIVVDETVMSESEVMMSCSCESCSSSCVDSSEMSDSATSHRLQLSYNESSPRQVSLSVSFQSGNCSDVETRVYEVTNFGMATVSPDEETVIFSFNESLLASGVNVTRIRGSCEDGSQEMLWDYPPTNISLNITSSCPNGSYTFQALTSGNMVVGFSISVEYTSPVTTSTAMPGATNIAASVAGSLVAVVAAVTATITAVVVLHCYSRRKRKAKVGVSCINKNSSKGSEAESPPLPPDSLYADPSTIEHEEADNGAMYAMIDKMGKKKKEPAPQEALYTDCGSVPSGDCKDSEKKDPDVVPAPRKEELNYIDVELSTGPQLDHPVKNTMIPSPVEYAHISMQH